MSGKLTKNNILTAALSVFTEKGFAGGSISDIAKKAEINQSLIYHHFKSKKDLWTHVKKHCVEKTKIATLRLREDTLEHFVLDLVEARFSVYATDNMRRLVHWQALEAEPSLFYDSSSQDTNNHAFNIPNYIKRLQKTGLIRGDIDYLSLSGIVFSLVSYAFFDFAIVYKLSPEQIQAHKNLVCENLIHLLQNPERHHEIG